MWTVATTDEFDAWFAALDDDGRAEVIAKVSFSKFSVPAWGDRTPTP
jgi:hypothetical protein